MPACLMLQSPRGIRYPVAGCTAGARALDRWGLRLCDHGWRLVRVVFHAE